MWEFFTSDANLPFLGALTVLVGIGILELIGLFVGLSFMDSSDLDADADLDFDGFFGDALHWIGFGRVPLLVLIALVSGIFAITGFTINHIAEGVVGVPLVYMLSIPLALIITLPILSRATRLVARILPKDETNAVTLASLVGSHGVVISGKATDTESAFARVYDIHSVQHVVRIRNTNSDTIAENSHITLLSYEEQQGFFYANKTN